MYIIITMKCISTAGYSISYMVYKPPKEFVGSDTAISLSITKQGNATPRSRSTDTMQESEMNLDSTQSSDTDKSGGVRGGTPVRERVLNDVAHPTSTTMSLPKTEQTPLLPMDTLITEH